ncbi:hypothetical protein C0581_00720, partial [Candidatus Parcubacteria bacterium]
MSSEDQKPSPQDGVVDSGVPKKENQTPRFGKKGDAKEAREAFELRVKALKMQALKMSVERNKIRQAFEEIPEDSVEGDELKSRLLEFERKIDEGEKKLRTIEAEMGIKPSVEAPPKPKRKKTAAELPPRDAKSSAANVPPPGTRASAEQVAQKLTEAVGFNMNIESAFVPGVGEVKKNNRVEYTAKSGTVNEFVVEDVDDRLLYLRDKKGGPLKVLINRMTPENLKVLSTNEVMAPEKSADSATPEIVEKNEKTIQDLEKDIQSVDGRFRVDSMLAVEIKDEQFDIRRAREILTVENAKIAHYILLEQLSKELNEKIKKVTFVNNRDTGLGMLSDNNLSVTVNVGLGTWPDDAGHVSSHEWQDELRKVLIRERDKIQDLVDSFDPKSLPSNKDYKKVRTSAPGEAPALSDDLLDAAEDHRAGVRRDLGAWGKPRETRPEDTPASAEPTPAEADAAEPVSKEEQAERQKVIDGLDKEYKSIDSRFILGIYVANNVVDGSISTDHVKRLMTNENDRLIVSTLESDMPKRVLENVTAIFIEVKGERRTECYDAIFNEGKFVITVDLGSKDWQGELVKACEAKKKLESDGLLPDVPDESSQDVDDVSSPEESIPEGYELLRRGEPRGIMFADRFVTDPENSENNTDIHVATGFAQVDGRSHYGGLGCKYAEFGEDADGNKVRTLESLEKAENEDSMFTMVDSEGALVTAVIDGAGGEGNGRAASRIINETAVAMISLGETGMKEALIDGHLQIENELANGMTTAVLARIEKDNNVTLTSVGDSKAMTLRGGKKLEAGTTKMHNFAVYLIEQFGEEPQDFFNHKFANQLLSSLGPSEKDRQRRIDGEEVQLPQIDEITFQGKEGDVMVLASDGLWDVASEYEVEKWSDEEGGDAAKLQERLWKEVYARNNAKAPFQIEYAPGKFIEKKWREGKGDNISIQVVKISEKTPALDEQGVAAETAVVSPPEPYKPADPNYGVPSESDKDPFGVNGELPDDLLERNERQQRDARRIFESNHNTDETPEDTIDMEKVIEQLVDWEKEIRKSDDRLRADVHADWKEFVLQDGEIDEKNIKKLLDIMQEVLRGHEKNIKEIYVAPFKGCRVVGDALYVGITSPGWEDTLRAYLKGEKEREIGDSPLSGSDNLPAVPADIQQDIREYFGRPDVDIPAETLASNLEKTPEELEADGFDIISFSKQGITTPEQKAQLFSDLNERYGKMTIVMIDDDVFAVRSVSGEGQTAQEGSEKPETKAPEETLTDEEAKIKQFEKDGFDIADFPAEATASQREQYIQLLESQGKEVVRVSEDTIASRDKKVESVTDDAAVESGQDDETTEGPQEEAKLLIAEMSALISEIPAEGRLGGSYNYVEPENSPRFLQLLARYEKLIEEHPEEWDTRISDNAERTIGGALEFMQIQMSNSYIHDAVQRAQEKEEDYESAQTALAMKYIYGVTGDDGFITYFPKKGHEFVSDDPMNFAVRKKKLLKRMKPWGRKDEVGKPHPRLELPEVTEDGPEEQEGIEKPTSPEQSRERLFAEYGIEGVGPDALNQLGFSVGGYENLVEEDGNMSPEAISQLQHSCDASRARGVVILLPEVNGFAIKDYSLKTPEELKSQGLEPLYTNSVLNRDKTIQLHAASGENFEVTPDGMIWSAEAQKYNEAEDLYRKANNLGEGLVEEHDKGIIDISERRLVEIIGNEGYRKMLQLLVDPTAAGNPEEYMKGIFRQGSIDQKLLREEARKFGYKNVEEFLTFWETQQGYKESLHTIKLFVAQEETNVLQGMKEKHHGALTKIWEHTQNAFISYGPAAVVVAGISLGGGFLTAAPKAFIRGLAGAVGGGAAAARMTKEGRERTLRRTQDMEARIQAKEDSILEALRGTPEFRAELMKKFSLATDQKGQPKGGDPSVFNKMAAFISDGLRISSYRVERSRDGSSVSDMDQQLDDKVSKDDSVRANAILALKNGRRKIAEGARAREMRGEISREESQNAQLDLLVAELHSDDELNVVKDLLKENPRFLNAMKKVMKVKRGEIGKYFNDESIDSETSDDAAMRIMLGALAGGAAGVAASLSEEVRAVVLGLAGAYLGAHVGNIRDMKKREEVLAQEVQGRITDAENAINNLGDGTRVDSNKSETMLKKFAKDIRVALSLGLIQNNEVLKSRARNVLRSIDRELMEDRMKNANAEMLLAGLEEDVTALKSEKQATIDKIKDRGNFFKRNARALVGAASGAAIGVAAGMFGKDLGQWAFEKMGITTPGAAAAALEETEAPRVESVSASVPETPELEPLPEVPEVPEGAQWDMDRISLIREFRLSPDAVKEMEAWAQAYPSLANESAMRTILEAATDRGSGETTMFPEAGFKDPKWILHFERERDLAMVGEMIKSGNTNEALLFLESQDFNNVSLGKLFPDGIPKDVDGALQDFLKQYQERVINMPAGQRDGDLIKRLGSALQHDANRDDYLADNANLFRNQRGGVTPLDREPGRPIVYMGMNETGAASSGGSVTPNKFIASGARGIGGGGEGPSAEDLRRAQTAQDQVTAARDAQTRLEDVMRRNEARTHVEPTEDPRVTGTRGEVPMRDADTGADIVVPVDGVTDIVPTPDGSGVTMTTLDGDVVDVSYGKLFLFSAAAGTGVLKAGMIMSAMQAERNRTREEEEMLTLEHPDVDEELNPEDESTVVSSDDKASDDKDGVESEESTSAGATASKGGGGGPAPEETSSSDAQTETESSEEEETEEAQVEKTEETGDDTDSQEEQVVSEDTSDASTETTETSSEDGATYYEVEPYGKVGFAKSGDGYSFSFDQLTISGPNAREMVFNKGQIKKAVRDSSMKSKEFDVYAKQLAGLEIVRQGLSETGQDGSPMMEGLRIRARAIMDEVQKDLGTDPRAFVNDRAREGFGFGGVEEKTEDTSSDDKGNKDGGEKPKDESGKEKPASAKGVDDKKATEDKGREKKTPSRNE